MLATPEAIAFESAVRPVLQIVLPDRTEALLKFRPSPELQARIEALASKSTENILSEVERAEFAVL